MKFTRTDIGTVRSFPRPPQAKNYMLMISPAFANKIQRTAEENNVSVDEFIVAALRTVIPGTDEQFLAEEQAHGTN
jgi:hypothetical protein